jgi:hypothetical protein
MAPANELTRSWCDIARICSHRQSTDRSRRRSERRQARGYMLRLMDPQTLRMIRVSSSGVLSIG